MPFAMIEVGSLLEFLAAQSPNVRVIASAGRISALVESDSVQVAMEEEVIADVKQKHQAARVQHGADTDLILEAKPQVAIRFDPLWTTFAERLGFHMPGLNVPPEWLEGVDPPAVDDADQDDDDGDTTPIYVGTPD